MTHTPTHSTPRSAHRAGCIRRLAVELLEYRQLLSAAHLLLDIGPVRFDIGRPDAGPALWAPQPQPPGFHHGEAALRLGGPDVPPAPAAEGEASPPMMSPVPAFDRAPLDHAPPPDRPLSEQTQSPRSIAVLAVVTVSESLVARPSLVDKPAANAMLAVSAVAAPMDRASPAEMAAPINVASQAADRMLAPPPAESKTPPTTVAETIHQSPSLVPPMAETVPLTGGPAASSVSFVAKVSVVSPSPAASLTDRVDAAFREASPVRASAGGDNATPGLTVHDVWRLIEWPSANRAGAVADVWNAGAAANELRAPTTADVPARPVSDEARSGVANDRISPHTDEGFIDLLPNKPRSGYAARTLDDGLSLSPATRRRADASRFETEEAWWQDANPSERPSDRTDATDRSDECRVSSAAIAGETSGRLRLELPDEPDGGGMVVMDAAYRALAGEPRGLLESDRDIGIDAICGRLQAFEVAGVNAADEPADFAADQPADSPAPSPVFTTAAPATPTAADAASASSGSDSQRAAAVPLVLALLPRAFSNRSQGSTRPRNADEQTRRAVAK